MLIVVMLGKWSDDNGCRCPVVQCVVRHRGESGYDVCCSVVPGTCACV